MKKQGIAVLAAALLTMSLAACSMEDGRYSSTAGDSASTSDSASTTQTSDSSNPLEELVTDAQSLVEDIVTDARRMGSDLTE